MITPNAYQPIKAAAKARLTVLHDNAITALMKDVQNITSRAALNVITRVNTNNELQTAGLSALHVAALQDENAFNDIKTLAAERLQTEEDTIAALNQKIRAIDDVGALYAIAYAKDNNALEAIVFEAGHIPALIDKEAFRPIATAAQQKLAARPHPDEARLPREPKLIAQDKAIRALKRVIVKSNDHELLTNISDVSSNGELLLLDDLELKHVEALCEEDAYQIITEAADERLTILDFERLRKKAVYLSTDYNTLMDEDKTILANMRHVSSIQKVDDKIRGELRLLAGIQPIHWFNPGFQAAAKKHATEMASHFKELAKGSHVLLKYLKPLHCDLVELLASIPNDDAIANATPILEAPHIKAIKDYRALLTRYLQQVDKELERYKPVSRLLDGDRSAKHPILKQGLLKTLKEAAAEKKDLKFFTFNSSTADHPMTERAQHFQSDYVSGPTIGHATTLIHTDANSPIHYDMTDAIAAETFREHTINGGKPLAGSFIEERRASFPASTVDSTGLGPYLPDIKLTINKFPTLANAPAPNTIQAHELTRARVEYALAFACLFLAESSGAPDAEHPIVLRGINLEELRYIWTALMILGKMVPYMKFDHNFIKVLNTPLHAEDELGRFYGFSNNSCYETNFKPHLSFVHELTAGIKEVSKDKLGHQETRRRTKQALETVFSTYKKKLSTTLEALDDDQKRKEQDDSAGLDR